MPVFSESSSRRVSFLISFESVSKSYRNGFGKRVEAVRDASFRIDAGEVVGIAGPNGAGKSTLIALMLGFMAPTLGRVSLDGRSPRAYAEQHGIGYLPELIPLNPLWRANDALRRFAILAGVPPNEAPQRIDAIVERVGLTEHRYKRCKQLSKGNLQKVGIAQALLSDQAVYVFDEPTHGLDPVATAQFRDVVRDMRRLDRSMLVASHNLNELEQICDRVVIIDRGQVQRIVDLRAAPVPVERASYRVRAVAGLAALLAAFAGCAESSPGEVLVSDVDLSTLNAGLARAIADGAMIAAVTPDRSALERQFHEAMRAPGAES